MSETGREGAVEERESLSSLRSPCSGAVLAGRSAGRKLHGWFRGRIQDHFGETIFEICSSKPRPERHQGQCPGRLRHRNPAAGGARHDNRDYGYRPAAVR